MIIVDRDALVEILIDMLSRVRNGDSWEGYLNYLLPMPPAPPETFDVEARYRIGNIDGSQGGMRMIGISIRGSVNLTPSHADTLIELSVDNGRLYARLVDGSREAQFDGRSRLTLAHVKERLAQASGR